MEANSLEELVTNSNIVGELRNYTDWHTRLVKFAQLVADWQKERIMEDAVEAIISQCPGSNEIIFYNPSTVYSWEFPWKFSAKGLNKGDKVRIVVLKAEEESK